MKKNLGRVFAAAVLVSGAVTGAVLYSGNSAMAATTGNLVLCAKGNYVGYADVKPASNPGQQLVGPAKASRGECTDYYYSGSQSNEELEVSVYGFYNDSGQLFFLGTIAFKPEVAGLTIDLLGTTTAPYTYAH
jgi:hypothetical protein